MNSHLLKARVATLIAKSDCSYETSYEEIQRLLHVKHDVQPPLEDIEDVIVDLQYDRYEFEGITPNICYIQ
jgi:hypothetical protein